jgi:hypothetical protein
MTEELKINGLSVTIHPRPQHKGKKVPPRYTVEGVMHPAGVLPIRFKSLERARRHVETIQRPPSVKYRSR